MQQQSSQVNMSEGQSQKSENRKNEIHESLTNKNIRERQRFGDQNQHEEIKI